MKKLMSMILALFVLATGFALAETWTPTEETWTESVTYRDDGIFIIDFIKDIPWRTEYLMTLTDEAGNPLTYIALGGDAGVPQAVQARAVGGVDVRHAIVGPVALRTGHEAVRVPAPRQVAVGRANLIAGGRRRDVQ